MPQQRRRLPDRRVDVGGGAVPDDQRSSPLAPALFKRAGRIVFAVRARKDGDERTRGGDLDSRANRAAHTVGRAVDGRGNGRSGRREDRSERRVPGPPDLRKRQFRRSDGNGCARGRRSDDNERDDRRTACADRRRRRVPRRWSRWPE